MLAPDRSQHTQQRINLGARWITQLCIKVSNWPIHIPRRNWTNDSNLISITHVLQMISELGSQSSPSWFDRKLAVTRQTILQKEERKTLQQTLRENLLMAWPPTQWITSLTRYSLGVARPYLSVRIAKCCQKLMQQTKKVLSSFRSSRAAQLTLNVSTLVMLGSSKLQHINQKVWSQ